MRNVLKKMIAVKFHITPYQLYYCDKSSIVLPIEISYWSSLFYFRIWSMEDLEVAVKKEEVPEQAGVAEVG